MRTYVIGYLGTIFCFGHESRAYKLIQQKEDVYQSKKKTLSFAAEEVKVKQPEITKSVNFINVMNNGKVNSNGTAVHVEKEVDDTSKQKGKKIPFGFFFTKHYENGKNSNIGKKDNFSF
jgi:hypothetical protein